MKEEQTALQRHGSHLILIALAGLLIFGARVLTASRNVELHLEEAAATPTGAPADGRQLDGGVLALQASASQAPRPRHLDDVPLLINYSLSPALNPLTFEGKRPEHELITYTVQSGDTPIWIAEHFGIKTETLLGGNPELSQESRALQAGAVLTILPVDGLLHDVEEGDTLESLVKVYGIPAEDIIAYEPNNLEFPYRLFADTQILIPGAVREIFVWTAPQPPRPPASTGPARSYGQMLGTGAFIWPVGARRITQVFWYGHQGVDIGVLGGSPVVASDAGTITWAGWNVYGYGNLVVVNHNNGFETYYAHLSGIAVRPGQVVYQGSYIGASGSTGRSSGPHLHFEIRYFNDRLNPLAILP
ncbi:MAG: peptidoglycan DD-metalloendopeptidase family protein [Candidatus Promineifilaceae bacterium]